jgi:hypothetical protein
MRRLFLLLPLALAASFAVPAARADVTSPTPSFMPVATPLTLRPLFGEPTSQGTGLAPGLAVLPLRLSMLGSAFPLAGSSPTHPLHCDPDASGNSEYGFPVERQVFLAMTSRLVLHGFSRLGCPVDAIAGGGVTYTIPLAQGVSIVPSAGAYAKSSLVQGRVPTRGTVRVDLMMHTSGDQTLSIGVGRQHGVQGLHLTGTW